MNENENENTQELSAETSKEASEEVETVENGPNAQSGLGYLGKTPPPNRPPAKSKRMWVDRPEQLLYAVSILKQFPVVAVDAEFTRARPLAHNTQTQTSLHRLALLQLAVEDHSFVVDAWRLNDLSPLKQVVENPEIIILLHGAGADMQVMADRGLNVVHYYDLEAASRSIFGQHQSSLAAMLRRALNVRMDKSLQRTDWSRRPLPPAMVAYAARDAEMTLALYHWLDQHYPWALQLHENTNQIEPVAIWIEPFLIGTALVSPDVAVTEAKEKGIIVDNAQIAADCREALATLTHPLHRTRLLKLIADLSLVQLAPDIEPLLQAPAAEERAASARALGRLGAKASKALIESLLQDPVQDVRDAAKGAVRNFGKTKKRQEYNVPAVKLTDGTRSWTIEGETNDTGGEDDWKARLRSMMGE